MLHEPDEEGRIPISGKEYNALRCLIVALNELEKTKDVLEPRIRTLANGWRDFRLMESMMSKVCDMILETVPTKKLLALREELRNSKITLTVGWAQTPAEGVAYVDEHAFIALLNRLISYECWNCDRKGKDVKRCEIRNAYMNTLHYEPAPEEIPKDGSCIMAGWSNVEIE